MVLFVFIVPILLKTTFRFKILSLKTTYCILVLNRIDEVTCVIHNHWIVELNCIPIRPKEKEKGHHDYNQTGTSIPLRGSCLNPDCKSRPVTICVGCTRDIKGFAYICKPSPRKDCWAKVHLAREPYPMDTNGNTIESPSLIKKRKRNSSLGSENISKRWRKSLCLNPHHSQV